MFPGRCGQRHPLSDQGYELWSQVSWGQLKGQIFLALELRSKLLKTSTPQFPHCKVGPTTPRIHTRRVQSTDRVHSTQEEANFHSSLLISGVQWRQWRACNYDYYC